MDVFRCAYHHTPFGAVAQLGERRVRNAEVVGSIPVGSIFHCSGIATPTAAAAAGTAAKSGPAKH